MSSEQLQKTRKVLSTLAFFFFVAFDLYITLINGLYKIPENNTVAAIVLILRAFLILLAAVTVILEFVGSGKARRDIAILVVKLLALALLVRFLAAWLSDHWICYVILFAILADGIEEDRLLRTSFAIGVSVVVVFFILSLLGIMENNRGNSFGFTYRTHYACFLMCMAMVWCIVKDGWLTWLGELGLLALDVFVFWLGGKTAFFCLAVLTVGVFWRHYRRNGGTPFRDRAKYGYVISSVFWLIYLPVALLDRIAEAVKATRLKRPGLFLMKHSFLICFGLELLFVFTFRRMQPFWDRFSALSTFRDRFLYGLMGFEEFPLTLFGNRISQVGASGTETYHALYYALDSGYVKIILLYGAFVCVALMGLMTLVQLRMHRNKRFFTMFVLAIFAVDNILEYQMINLSYNLFVLLAFCVLSRKPGIEACGKLNLGGLPAKKRWGLAGGACAALLIAALLCSTAYRITNWRGWTPYYDATVVVAGEDPLALETTADYLLSHEDAVCVVTGDGDRSELASRGIGAERILVREAENLDALLTQTHALIQSEGLPSRLTVCAPMMQMERISCHARSLQIPINSLTYQPKGLTYLRSFAAEQWRLLWGKD